ncbi:MAG TPA: alpha-hydroxy acid oxidase [Xanthobacteraceae bacterium]|jgi:L-lactate dehydrogenase (cytochrome)|nr:alpha-hydroxy acid oxidase [Xanthobacteraceae bacterium]
MLDTAALAKTQLNTQLKPPVSPSGNSQYAQLHRRFPSTQYLRDGARRRIPHFAFEYADGGAGNGDKGIKRNWAAFDAVELAPRYGVMPSLPPTSVELFGRRFSAPIGVAPMGGPSIVWPGADEYLARAAQRAGVPYMLSTVGGATIERIAEVAPDVFWFQLYRFAGNDHAIGLDLLRRAERAGCRTLVLTLDVPVRTTRPREAATGLAGSFRVDRKIVLQSALAPAWAMALWRNGTPRFANVRAYAGEGISLSELVAFTRREMGGAFTWDEVAKYREWWKGNLIVKGVMHPADAEKAVSLGADGVIVSNHGGRQNDALPASIDVLPAIVREVGSRTTVMIDSGVRSGSDIVRACALGASACFAGKAFLWGLGALGADGPGHVIDLLIEETQAAMGQLGALSVEALRSLTIRHPGVFRF